MGSAIITPKPIDIVIAYDPVWTAVNADGTPYTDTSGSTTAETSVTATTS
jgi:hypothetical protein